MSVIERYAITIEAKGLYAETEWEELGNAVKEAVKAVVGVTGGFEVSHYIDGAVDCVRMSWRVEGNYGLLSYLREAHDVLAEVELSAHSIRVEVALCE